MCGDVGAAMTEGMLSQAAATQVLAKKLELLKLIAARDKGVVGRRVTLDFPSGSSAREVEEESWAFRFRRKPLNTLPERFEGEIVDVHPAPGAVIKTADGTCYNIPMHTLVLGI